jgi:hypothetical protein
MANRIRAGRSTSITQSGTRLIALSAFLLGGVPLSAETVLVPIVARVYGQRDASWTTEVRITNRTELPKIFKTLDWVGTSGFKPASYTIPSHSTTSIGGSNMFGAQVPEAGAVGLAICDAETGILVQSAVLSGIATGGVSEQCPSYDGGGGKCPGLSGAGPILDGLTFSSAGHETYIPWLHTEEFRRTNLVLINPDDTVAHVTVSIKSQDGFTTIETDYVFDPRSYNQINDVFAQEPWSAVRVANERIPVYGGGAAASATISSDTRLLAVAYVISNNNNSLTVSLAR